MKFVLLEYLPAAFGNHVEFSYSLKFLFHQNLTILYIKLSPLKSLCCFFLSRLDPDGYMYILVYIKNGYNLKLIIPKLLSGELDDT